MSIKLHSTQKSHFGGIFISGVFEDKYFTARLYYHPCKTGINGSCVVSLTVCDSEVWDGNKQIFNYDRGPDVAKIEAGYIDRLVDALIPFQPPEPSARL